MQFKLYYPLITIIRRLYISNKSSFEDMQRYDIGNFHINVHYTEAIILNKF